jgi:hypothetical protein
MWDDVIRRVSAEFPLVDTFGGCARNGHGYCRPSQEADKTWSGYAPLTLKQRMC